MNMIVIDLTSRLHLPALVVRGVFEGLLDRQGTIRSAQHTCRLPLRHSSWHAPHGFQLVGDHSTCCSCADSICALLCPLDCIDILCPYHHLATHVFPYIIFFFLCLNSFISRGREPWTLTNKTKDSERTLPAKHFKEISYPKADGIISFDLLTSLSRSGKHCI